MVKNSTGKSSIQTVQKRTSMGPELKFMIMQDQKVKVPFLTKDRTKKNQKKILKKNRKKLDY
jgi:hypothetical protein